MLHGFQNNLLQEETPLTWLQSNFYKINWVQDQKYPGCIASAPIYDQAIANAITLFFFKQGLHQSVSGQSKVGGYHRVFLNIDDVRSFIIADKFRSGRYLQWHYMLESHLPTDALETLHHQDNSAPASDIPRTKLSVSG